MVHPQFGILLKKLLDLELEYKNKHIELIRKGNPSKKPVIEIEKLLLFEYLYNWLENNKDDVLRHNLRSVSIEEDFKGQIFAIIGRIHSFFYKDHHLDDLENSKPEQHPKEDRNSLQYSLSN